MRIHLPNWNAVRAVAVKCLRQGVSPRRLAVTLALGFVMGCIPVIGIPTVLCAAVALLFRLNLPAIQAANYLAMPLQVALVVPFVRLGAWLVPFATRPGGHSSVRVMEQAGLMAGQAVIAWLLVAVPVALVLTVSLTGLLRRIPALENGE